MTSSAIATTANQDDPSASAGSAPSQAADALAAEAGSIYRPGSDRKSFRMGDIFTWDEDRLAVTDDVAMKALTRPALSPSTAKAMSGCVARWAAERLIDEEPNPFSAAEIGTSGHAVLEDLYGLPAEYRTRSRMLLILEAHRDTAWPGIDDASRAKAIDWQAAVLNAINGLWAIENPTAVEVYGLEHGFKDATVCDIPFTGFIDRLDWVIDPETGQKRLKVVDYKTGRVPKDIGRFGDDHGDQMRLYAEAIRSKTGAMPQTATLLYTQHGKSRDVPLSKSAMSKTLSSFRKAWKDLSTYTQQASYPTQDGPLCGWCPLVNACPVAKQNGRVDRTGHAPDAEFLGMPTRRPLPPKPVEETVDLRTRIRSVTDPGYDFSADFGSASNDASFGDDFGSAAVGMTPPADDFGSGDFGSAAVEDPEPTPAAIPVAYDPATEPSLAPIAEAAAQAAAETVPAAQRSGAGAAHEDTEDISVPGHEQSSVHHHQQPATGPEGNPMTVAPTSTALFSEDKSWFEESGGMLNANSYAAMAVFGTTGLAYDLIQAAGVPLTKDTLDGVSKTFLWIVQQVHVEFAASPSLMDGFNTRLRGLLRSVVEANPMPFGGDANAWNTWVALAHKHLRSLTLAASRLYADGPGDQPWLLLAAPAPAQVG